MLCIVLQCVVLFPEKMKKSLTESAKEYESRQVKRKFDEVAVVTGEEEESNVLQVWKQKLTIFFVNSKINVL